MALPPPPPMQESRKDRKFHEGQLGEDEMGFSFPTPPPQQPPPAAEVMPSPSLPPSPPRELEFDDVEEMGFSFLTLPRPTQTGPSASASASVSASAASSLYKQRSWSPDIFREEAWMRRKGNSKNRRSKSVTDEDLDELKACIELGFGFDSPEVAVDQRLSDTLPALELYCAVNKQYNDIMSKSARSLPAVSDCDSSPSSASSSANMFCPGDSPQVMKTRLRRWAQVVACSVRQSTW